ncbi:MAG TPA: dihydrodipicolinate synthase family protein [Rectinemataceae bacterium]|nr:dihydrodipicolinate synthase family protein [Rectinemataceae bacterium]
MGTENVRERRAAIISTLHPEGIPSLWCPPITHYGAKGGIDAARSEAHLGRIIPSAPCLLIPGSTGDGWEMGEAETEALLRCLFPIVASLGGKVLVGALHPNEAAAKRAMETRMNLALDVAGEGIRAESLLGDPEKAAAACAKAGIAGFAVCAPAGIDLSQGQILAALSDVLDMGLPTAVYQLPQVTKNEIEPETFALLLSRYPNLYLFKDTSGLDQVALADIDRGGVFFARGAEGDYSRWISRSGNPEGSAAEHRYDGFLLSSANVFAVDLAEMILALHSGEEAKANQISGRIDRVVKAVFAEAAKLPYGNAFSNANRALDWVMTGGTVPRQLSGLSAPIVPAESIFIEAPRTHCGEKLPVFFLRFAARALASEGYVMIGF